MVKHSRAISAMLQAPDAEEIASDPALQMLERLPDEFTTQQARDLCPEISRQAVNDRLNKLIDNGHIIHSRKGCYEKTVPGLLSLHTLQIEQPIINRTQNATL